MKTKIIELLNQPPVKLYEKRWVTHSPILTVGEESHVDVATEEHYRFEARLGASFWLADGEDERGRTMAYRNLKRYVAEEIYGEVREQVFQLMPLIANMQLKERREASNIVNNILEMTIP